MIGPRARADDGRRRRGLEGHRIDLLTVGGDWAGPIETVPGVNRREEKPDGRIVIHMSKRLTP